MTLSSGLKKNTWTYAIIGLLLLFIGIAVSKIISVNSTQAEVRRNVDRISNLSAFEHAIGQLEDLLVHRASTGFTAYNDALDQVEAARKKCPAFSDSATRADLGMVRTIISRQQPLQQVPDSLVLRIFSQTDKTTHRIQQEIGQIRQQQGAISRQLAADWTIVNTVLVLACVIALGAALLFLRYRNTHEKLREALEKILRMNEELEQHVKERTVALSGAVSELSGEIEQRKKTEFMLNEKIRELDFFIYRSSHDLRGPLSTMQGLINILNAEAKDPLLTSVGGKMEQANRRLDTLLTDLAEIAGIDNNRIAFSPVDFRAALEAALGSLQQLPQFPRVNIRFENCDGVIVTDVQLLRIILGNVLRNSFTYARIGFQPFIRISLAEDTAHFLLTIEDNGSGIADSHLGKVFDLFYRAHDHPAGSGVGLYKVRNAVERLNGTISIRSKVKTGTTVSISLPKVQAR